MYELFSSSFDFMHAYLLELRQLGTYITTVKPDKVTKDVQFQKNLKKKINR